MKREGEKMKNLLELLLYLICGIPVVFAVDEDDPELCENPRKKARIRRKWRRERSKSGTKENG
jgi:hypothetical protein